MISLFIIPVLLCGIIWIKITPKQKARISTYQGWIIYLYAFFYGVVALSSCWLVLEYVLPIFFKIHAAPINNFLMNLSIDTAVSENYLDRMALHVINKPPVALPEGDAYSNFMTARATIISALSVLFTFAFSFIVLLLGSIGKEKKKRILDIYKHDSPTDHQLMLIGARLAENEDRIFLLKKGKSSLEKLISLKKECIELLNKKSFTKGVLYFVYNADRYGFFNSLKFLLKADAGSSERKDEAFKFYNNEMNVFFNKKIKDKVEKLKILKGGIDKNPIYVQVTLDSRKVYIGIPKQIGSPNEKSIGNEEISLLPVYSGYRDADSLGIVITNKYVLLESDFYTDINNVVIKKEKVSSVSAFSMKYYKQVQGGGDEINSLKRKTFIENLVGFLDK